MKEALKTSVRIADLRISAGWKRRPYAIAPSGCSAFIQAILGRYGLRLERGSPLALVLRQSLPGTLSQSVYHQTRVLAAPRLALTVASWSHVILAGLTNGAVPGQSGRDFLKRVEILSAEQLVRHLISREKRIEYLATAGMPDTPLRNPRHAVIPDGVEKTPGISRRLAPAVAKMARRNEEPAADNRPPAAKTLPVAGDQRSVAPPAIDLNRLTDQVIQAIDRRIVAQRERLGRV